MEGEWSHHCTKPALSMKPLKSFATVHVDQRHAHIICHQTNEKFRLRISDYLSLKDVTVFSGMIFCKELA